MLPDVIFAYPFHVSTSPQLRDTLNPNGRQLKIKHILHRTPEHNSSKVTCPIEAVPGCLFQLLDKVGGKGLKERYFKVPATLHAGEDSLLRRSGKGFEP